MAFSRKSIVAAFAGTLSLALMAGCNNPAPTQPGTSTSPSSSTAPTTAPTGQPTNASGTTPVASGTPTPTPSAPNIGTTTFSGTVYDETGATVAGAKVEAKSLNASAPFDTTVDVNSGNYVINGAPAGVSIQVTITKTGYTSRSRVVTLLPLSSSQPNIVNFGGPTNNSDPSGNAYFISDYPEVSSVSPADQSTGNSATTYKYVLTLSEPLDQTNQSRFKNEIRIWPANQYAIPGASSDPTSIRTASVAPTDLPMSTDSGSASSSPYAISNSSFFGQSSTTSTTATVSFDSTGQVATLTFNAPLLTNNNNTPRYQMGLYVPSGSTPADDGNGHKLGTGSWGGALGSAASGSFVFEAFESPSLSVSVSSGQTLASSTDAWKQTHNNGTYFDLSQDNTAPTLTAVTVDKVAGNSRIDLTFSKPMAAYDANYNNSEYIQTSTLTASNYIFAFGKTNSDVAGVDLNNASASPKALGAINSGDTVTLNNVNVDVDPNNPAVVRLTGNTGSTALSSDLGAIKVFVKNAQDPAGNVILNNNSTNVQTGNI